jgi:ATP-dependent RNA helicase DHX36
MEMVSAILCAGLYPNVVQCKRRGKRTAFFTKEVGKVDIHPASVNAGVHLFPLPYMVYSERVKTTSIYVRDSTNISDYALLLFGGNLVASKNGEGIEMLRGYLHFSASKSVLDLIQVTFLNRFPLSLCFLFIIYIKVNTILFGVSAETEGRTIQASE